jgi:hypothetical protein
MERNITKNFSDVLPFIQDNDLRERLVLILDEYLPNYWFSVGASSTGKYHPSYAAGEGGLLRHSKAAMAIGYELLENPLFGNSFSAREKDLLLIALLIHDGIKYNFEKEEHTRFDHPVLMARFIMDNYQLWDISEEDATFMSNVVASHMGPWNTSKYDQTVLPVPETEAQKFVHLCDYLASRKLLNVYFDEDGLIIR